MDGKMANTPPDWTTLEKDILCPLCEYNLRGLTESRCPECGFEFTWRELLDAEKNRHPYLFEYGRGRNIKTFWKTFWRTCRPRRFWKDLNPAQEVRWGRLLVYWFLSNVLIAGMGMIPFALPLWKVVWMAGNQTFTIRSDFSTIPGRPGFLSPAQGTVMRYPAHFVITQQQLDSYVPPPWKMKFWDNVWHEYLRSRIFFRRRSQMPNFGWAAIFLIWPWISLGSLLVFRLSMRQAKIKTSHVIRTLAYSCDFSLLMLLVVMVLSTLDDVRYKSGWLLLGFAAFCAVITFYRLTMAFKFYLRVHLPMATVLSSQLIAFLITFIALIQIADFTRRI
jgi:hypothetical protein